MVVDHPERAAADRLVVEHGHQQQADSLADVGRLEAEDERSRLGVAAVQVGVQIGDQQLDVGVVEPHPLDREAGLRIGEGEGVRRGSVPVHERESPDRLFDGGHVSVRDPPCDTGVVGPTGSLADRVGRGSNHHLTPCREPRQLHTWDRTNARCATQ